MQKGSGYHPATPDLYLTIDEVIRETASSTNSADVLLEQAFIENRLVTSSTYSAPRSGDEYVLAAPSFSKDVADMGDCGIQSNPYCALFKVGKDEKKLIVSGSKIFGFQEIERLVDDTHAQVLTAWSLYNFTSIDRQLLDITTGELVPLLTIEIDQDVSGASMNVAGEGRRYTLIIEGAAFQSRLSPERVFVSKADGTRVASLSDAEVSVMKEQLAGDRDRKLETIFVMPSSEDVSQKSIHVELYGVPYLFDLKTGGLQKLTNAINAR